MPERGAGRGLGEIGRNGEKRANSNSSIDSASLKHHIGAAFECFMLRGILNPRFLKGEGTNSWGDWGK